jgi:mRNA interferase RelE/StbE
MHYTGMAWTALTVEWTRAAEKDLRGLDAKVVRQIRDVVTTYAATGIGDVKKLQGAPGYRLRARMWRVFVLIAWTELRLTVLAVEKRGDAY